MEEYRAKPTKEWKARSFKIRTESGWCCDRCHHPHKYPKWVLTVHHWDGDADNNNRNNLVAVCQSCHMKIKPLFTKASGMHEFWELLDRRDKKDATIGVKEGWYLKWKRINEVNPRDV